MEVLQIKNSLLNENTYFVKSNNNDCILIDPGFDFNNIISTIKSNNLNVLAILITHGHYDHIFSCKKLQDLGYKVYISAKDADKCLDNALSLAKIDGYTVDTFVPNNLILDDVTNIVIGDFNIGVVHVPGHTKGGLAFVIDNYIFTGDTLFDHGYGRYDFYDGDYGKLMQSLRILLKYKKNGFIVMAGH